MNTPRSTTRYTVEEVTKVDVRYLARNGMTEPGYSGTLSWWRGGHKTSSIDVRGYGTQVEFVYSWRDEHVEQTIQLVATECHLGGERVWFLCPWCRRRCAILYGAHREFACRLCYRLNYDSQRNNGRYVSITRAHKVLERLGAEPGTPTFPDRPKGMHWRTYRRLANQYQSNLRIFGAVLDSEFGTP